MKIEIFSFARRLLQKSLLIYTYLQTLPDNGRLSTYQLPDLYQSHSLYQQLGLCQQRGTCITRDTYHPLGIYHPPGIYLARVKGKTQKSIYTQNDFCNTLLTNKTLFLCYNVIVNKVPLELYCYRCVKKSNIILHNMNLGGIIH